MTIEIKQVDREAAWQSRSFRIEDALCVPGTVDKFWSLVSRGQEDECLPWLGSKTEKGYGYLRVSGKNIGAHRISLTLAQQGRPIRDGMLCLHSCDNPKCVNPAHLREGTYKDNIEDAIERNRAAGPAFTYKERTHCSYGHPLEGENLVVRYRAGGKAYRGCRECRRDEKKRFNARHRDRLKAERVIRTEKERLARRAARFIQETERG